MAKRLRNDSDFSGHTSLYEGDQILFTGILKNGKKNGSGTLFHSNGVPLYHGAWKNDLYEGPGILYYPCGNIHMKGTFSKGKAKCKQMLVYDTMGRIIFSGEFCNNEKVQGQWFEFENISLEPFLKGNSTFLNGIPNGHGTITHHLSKTIVKEYKGGIFNRIPQGKGTLVIKNFGGMGSDMYTHYEGDFLNGNFEGSGILSTGEFKYTGEFHNGKRHGKGICLSTEGEMIYDGFFHKNVYHGYGILSNLNHVFKGTFVHGNLLEGEIWKNNIILYKGKLHDYVPKGRGIMYFSENVDDWSVETEWNGLKCVPGHKTRIQMSASHTVDALENFDEQFILDADNKLYYSSCVERKNGEIVFTGSAHFHLESLKFCRSEGTLYIYGKRRITALFESGVPVDITEVYDQHGNLTIVNDDGYIGCFDGEWPTEIRGNVLVHNEDGSFMYCANYEYYGIKNCFQVANKLSTKTYIRDDEFQDMISMDTIPFGTICYMLNGNEHVVSKETLKKMRDLKSLFKHPLTRAPIMRIEKVVAQKSS
jgi:hypothetical protein